MLSVLVGLSIFHILDAVTSVRYRRDYRVVGGQEAIKQMEMSRMHMRSAVVWLAVLAVMVSATDNRVDAQTEVPFDAMVTGDAVLMYAGAGHSFYSVGELAGGRTVTVEEVIFGWYKIASPAGTFSYIEAGLVEPVTDQATAVVTSRRASVKAGSTDGASQSYRRQLDLLRGDRVRVIEKEGGYYKIVPPRGAYVFLPPGSVRVVTAHDRESDHSRKHQVKELPTVGKPIDHNQNVSTQNEQNALKTSAQHTAAVEADINPASTEKQVPVHEARTMGEFIEEDDPAGLTEIDWSNLEQILQSESSHQEVKDHKRLDPKVSVSIRQAERKLRSLMTLPLEEQPIDELLDNYNALRGNKNLSSIDRQIVTMRIKQLNRQAQLRSALTVVSDAQQEQPVNHPDKAEQPKPAYLAVGEVAFSGVYDGNRMPLLYRVVDGQTDRTIAYIRPVEGVDLTAYLGQQVGVVGQSGFDSELQLSVIHVHRVDRVADESGAKTAMSPGASSSTP